MLLFIFIAALAAASTSAQTGRYGDIISYLTYRRYSTFVSLIKQAGLTDTIKQGTFTVFAPSNSALRRVDPSITSDPTRLKQFVSYHFVSGNHTHSEFYNEHKLHTLAGSELRINHYTRVGMYTAEGQRIISFDRRVGGGIVHLIHGVLIPPSGTILDIIHSQPNMTVFSSAVKTAGLEHFLQDQHPITLFAPTDAAFATLGEPVVQGLLQNTNLLTQIIDYHVVPGTIFKAAYHTEYLHTFEEADRIKLHKFLFFGYEADNGGLVGRELPATNGVVHLVDHVLVPSSLAAQVSAIGGQPVTTVVP